MPPRCYLFVPADQPRMLDRAPERGADALIIDTEDAVAPAGRRDALAAAGRWVRERGASPVELWVRVPNEDIDEEVKTILSPRLTGVVVPKVRSAEDVLATVRALGTPGERTPGVIAMIENAEGLEDAGRIAKIPGVARLMIGEVDMAAELGIDPGEELAWWPLRSRVVVASAAAGLDGPIGPVNADFSSQAALEIRAKALRRHGFRAGAAIHPDQIGPYQKGFAPSPAELAAAQRMVDLYDAALSEGRGSIVDDQGNMVDEAHMKSARRLLEEA